MIREGVVLFVSSVTCLGCRSVPRPSDAGGNEARAAEVAVESMFVALDRRDYSAARGFTTADFELLEDTLVLDMSGLVAFVRPYHERGMVISRQFTDFRTEVNGRIAWTRYRQHGTLRIGDQRMSREWLESAVLLKENGMWKLDRLQSINVPTPRQPPR